MKQELSWSDYALDNYEFTNFPANSFVIDVGCGWGSLVKRLKERGCQAIGTEVDSDALAGCREQGLTVIEAPAEALPFENNSVDGLICKGVIPYTDEQQALAELVRVLKPGGRLEAMYLGAGYYTRYVMSGPSLKRRFYGSRALVNTIVYRLSGRLLPGWVGDTVYQSHVRLVDYYARFGLTLLRTTPSPTFYGMPVFIYHTLEKRRN